MNLRINLKLAVSWAMLILLSGCAVVPSPKGVTAGQLDVQQQVMFVEDATSSAETVRAENAVRKLLILQSYRITSASDVGVIVSFAKHAPYVGFETHSDEVVTNDRATTNSVQRRNRLNFCDEDVYRLTVTFVDQASGIVAYRGFAEQVSCDPPVDNDMYVLAASALRSLRKIA